MGGSLLYRIPCKMGLFRAADSGTVRRSDSTVSQVLPQRADTDSQACGYWARYPGESWHCIFESSQCSIVVLPVFLPMSSVEVLSEDSSRIDRESQREWRSSWVSNNLPFESISNHQEQVIDNAFSLKELCNLSELFLILLGFDFIQDTRTGCFQYQPHYEKSCNSFTNHSIGNCSTL